MQDHHDHSAMLANASTAADPHAHHMMDHNMAAAHGAVGNGAPMKDMMMMAMTFHGGYKETILFDQWSTKTAGAFVASWIAVFLLAVAYEALKTLRDYLSRRNRSQTGTTQVPHRDSTLLNAAEQESERTNETDLVPSIRSGTRQKSRARLLSSGHFVQTFLHIIQMAISYLLMLVAMTYNTYLFFAVVLGAGLGHFLFAWCRSSVVDYNDHCH